ncbi:MAG: response regulator transcription factor [Crocinitomicaceae bacterium]|nr:response regulator transcription factor [Crocinitomicaceae bacterium]
MNTIYLVEDEKSLADLIRFNLEMEEYSVHVFENGLTAFNATSQLATADLVILDVMLPGKSGFEICTQLRRTSDVPILFLSAKGTTEDRIQGLKLGANDYLPKPFDLEELLLRVSILTKKSDKSISLIEYTIAEQTINFETYEVINNQHHQVLMLSKKEIDLLKLFIENENKVVSRDEILDRLWGKDQFPTARTIDNYILAFRKLFEQDPKNPLYFHSIRGVGYKFTPVY